ncbi:MAG: DUF3987 domain-containing protein [Nostocaceae cyanobacterium]|nr:DUF3987 domain-containing protein [Nostocaceae cyanobacterium]
MSQKQLVSAPFKKAIKLPTLWVEDILTAQHLAGMFHVIGFNAISGEIPAGENYILVEPGTPEADIRGIAWNILKSGRECNIFWTNEHFVDQLVRDKFTAARFTKDIFDRAKPYTEWAAINDPIKITPREASEIARVAIAILPESQKLVELAQLRTRSGQSSWDWGNLVKSLEREFAQELQRRQREPNRADSTQVQNVDSVVNLNGSVDNSLLSTLLSTPQADEEKVLQAIVSIVSIILGSNYPEFLESHKLDTLYTECKQKVSRKLFDSIVASQRVKTSEVLPEDELRLKSLMDFSQTKINWDEVLPAPLARDMKHDADVLNIDPVMIWQALLSAVSSLSGGFKLNEYGGVPAINWTCTVLPSGGGKTRADNLVLSPLRKLQIQADADYKEKNKQYQRSLTQYEKAGDDSVDEPEKPALRKYLFEVATIQSVLKRLSEQGENHGSLWARDEIKGLFSSLNQFSGNEGEATELVLKLWDNKPTFVDRVDIEKSFTISNPSISLTGGIQNDVFRKVFKDADDANGMQARFLFAVPSERKKKYTSGKCQLSSSLPALYEWLENLNPETVKIAPDAQNYFAKLVGVIGDQIEQVSHAGIRTWMNKLDTHILRIALVLHLIECFYSPANDITTLSLATLKRAVAFAEYYRSSFHILQEKVTCSDDIASIMLQIHTAALNKHPDGIGARDVHRASRPIQHRAKAAGREAGAYVVDLFEKMASMGYGEVVRKGRSVRFLASNKPILENHNGGVDSADNSQIEPQEPISTKEKDCQHDCRQYPIVNVDNRDSTDIRIEDESQIVMTAETAVTGVDLPPVGSWVKIEGKVARVIKHYPEASDRVILDGQLAGNFIYGGYQISDCVVLTKLEVLEMGLKSS